MRSSRPSSIFHRVHLKLFVNQGPDARSSVTLRCMLCIVPSQKTIVVMFKTRAAVLYRDLKPRGAAEWF